MSRGGSTFLLLALAGSFLSTRSRAELSEVWALDDGTKVKRDALEHPLRRGNGVFEPARRRVKLFGLRNETVAFQVILRGGDRPTRDVRLRLEGVGTITNRGSSDDPDTYFRDRNIELFVQHYVEVRTRSGEALPEELAGPIPDALIPLRGTTLVPARSNQGFWVDIYLPKTTRPGILRGALRVETEGKPCSLPSCLLEIELEVLPLTLPDAPTIKTMLYFSGAERDWENLFARYFPQGFKPSRQQLEALRTRHYKLARRHRVTLFVGVDESPDDELRDRITGRAFTRAAGYSGPGEGVGQDMHSIHTYGGKLTRPEARRWADWFSLYGSRVEYFLYTFDEPHDPRVFGRINAVAREARPVPAFVTARPQPGLEVDIYATAPGQFSVETARQARSLGKRIWIYNGERPFTGTFVTDDTAVSPRVNPWIQYKYGIPRWFYWESTYYQDFQGGRGAIDVYKEANNYSNRDGDRANGDGLLFYPGRDYVFPEEDRGLNMPLPSIRLKNWRRGIQDVEYLVLLRQAGLGGFAADVVSRLVPRALADEKKEGELASWPEDGERWLKARRLLFAALKTGRPPVYDPREIVRPEETLRQKARGLMRRTIKSRKRLGLALLLGLSGGGVVFFLKRRGG